jgi:predicted dehydrogenase
MSGGSNLVFSRRRFLKNAAATLALPALVPSSVVGADGQTPPSERITIGMIGVGRQVVAYNLAQFVNAPNAQVVALCDVDRWRLELTNERIATIYGGSHRCGPFGKVDRYTDFREVLARKDVDAVMISTPDHWHVPIALAAVKAGKDVCLEKPNTRSIHEGRVLSDFVTKHNRVFRMDSEFRSKPYFHRAVELVRNGYIGKLHTIRTGVPMADYTSPPVVKMPVPEELDYEMWLGPAPKADYTEERVQQRKGYERPGWMCVRDYCDGLVTNWGTHLNDIAQWGNDTERTGPIEVEGRGVWPPAGSMWDVLMNFEVTYRFANGVTHYYKSETPYCRFEGDEGWVRGDFSTGTLDAEPKSLLTVPIKPDGVHFPLKDEKQDFLDCVKSRGRTLEDAEVAHRTTSLCHLGLIAVQIGQKLRWDPEAERFPDNDDANKLLKTPPLREPWTLEKMMGEA